MTLQLFDVRYFLAAVDGGSLLAGAKRAHVTAAAMTKALQRLEVELGVRLMTRTTRGAVLTADGERLLGPLRALVHDADRVQEMAQGRSAALSGDLVILAMEVFSPFLLPRALTALLAAHPQLFPRTYESIPERMVELVGGGRADVAFTIGRPRSPSVRVVELGVNPGVLVCGRSHPLRRRRKIGAADLAKHPSVVPRFWSAEHLPSLDQFPDERWPRSIGATIELMRMGVALVEEGHFLGYFPEIAIRRELASGSLLRLPSPASEPFHLVAVLPRAGGRPAAEALVREMKRVVAVPPRHARR